MSFKVQTLSNRSMNSLFKPWTVGLSKEGSSKTVDDFQSQTSQQSISLIHYIITTLSTIESSSCHHSAYTFILILSTT